MIAGNAGGSAVGENSCSFLNLLHCISIIYVGDGQRSVPTRETGDCCDDHKTHAYFASEEMERN
mgnify:CR=1 FL=1